MSDFLEEVECRACGYTFPNPSEAMLPSPQRPECPECGSTTRKAKVLAVATVGFHVSAKVVGKSPGDTSKSRRKKGFYEAYLNKPELHRKLGRWHVIERVFDRRRDEYHEVVTDKASGEIVHECHEPLTQHQGHGSARARGEKAD